ncbi:MAG TPA: ABC transporter ATP-binding protein [Candidatus Binataceae bacterium]|nr:ABC transporter ATP-binding protein [Candidatus Binataceae bacterium]
MSATREAAAAPVLRLRGVRRRFASGGGLDAIDLEIAAGEFFVLLGPSGCGKSTLLRLVAGLDTPQSGAIELGGRALGDGAGGRGEVAMVFQNFALYPHLSAFDNIAFPLRLRRMGSGEIARRVGAAAKMAGLDLDLGRRPHELSGGERQRVALARALVREPRVVLMDEPLSSLDPQLRQSLRVELKEFHRRTGRTFLYVTHDQTDALTLADRLAVMRAGRIEQVGTPAEVYDRPQTEFVARFVGEPAMNLVRVALAPKREALMLGDARVAVQPPSAVDSDVTLGMRPSDLSVSVSSPHKSPACAADAVEIPGEVEDAEFVGARYLVTVRVGASLSLKAESAERLEPTTPVMLAMRRARLHFFDPASGRRLE